MAENWEKWCGKVVQGKFRLEQYVGGSDRAGVFLTADRQQPGSKAVIKLVLAKPANAELQLSRWKEAATLSHPHLLRLLESGRCDLEGASLLYVVMEYAEESLAQILPQRSLTGEETGEMLRAVLDTLAYLHHAGFVHGRLAPSNILVVNDALKLSSDGIIKMNELSGRTQRTAYDPPEAATMTTSAAGDIWSLGVVLVEALTQKLPSFNGSESGNGKASDPEISASLPEPFQEIIRNCLRTDPERRWSVDRVASRLEIASVHDSTESPDTGPRPSASRRYLVLLIVVLAIAVAAGILMHGSHNSSGQVASDQTASDQPTSPATQSTQPESSQPALPRSAQNDTGHNEGRTPPAAVNSSPPSQTNTGRKLSVKMSDSVNAPTQGVIHELIPAVPLSARRTIHGKVRVQVRVEVDPSGDVTAVKFISPGPSKYFARLAQTAAQQWKFVPLQANGQNVASAWTLKFAFGREATQVSPARAD